MARVTVEDCVDKIPNRYELLMVAAQRAKDISAGAPITVARDNDKNPVIALREIADETVSIEELQKSLVMGLQKYVEVEEPEEEELEIMAAEKELADLIYKYGEERKSRQIAARIAERRRIKPIETTKELAEMNDGMQVHGDDDDALDLDAVDAGSDDDLSLDEEGGLDDGFDLGDDAGEDFDEE